MATIFSRIINGELPGRFVYRDDRVVAFLSIQPMSLGHTLVVPIEEIDQWTDCDPELWQHLSAVAQRVGQAVKPVAGTARAATLVAGFEVPHLHIHVFGADDMSGFQLSESAAKQFDDAELDRAQAEIAAALER
ncbi:HIT family protein [Enemella evansiae]|uniref:HIT family protein n=1 Tax=Enemella evansiae TaxID=2016499 RepID=A0A255GC26_9ACTN|nr:HIT family protein [Enemella evansiae]PFG68397.1 diadenosine tetraphosphate (Ap4A) HIT family hydrolase [Propionibacteriaceae bacterium ES.041]OYN95665.1 HIT family protein [Enemella evansiae]OYO00344.1 HIT family protein [Enemella evansiae]OYO03666.1 HIT family protein [Enemella evansiae]OYO10095.1 HIT family protein [Enemella evansiae]